VSPAPGSPSGRFADLGTRVASGVVLAAIAFAAVWLGGFAAVALVALALCLMLWELHRMATGEALGPALAVMCCAAVLGAAFVVAQGAAWGVACLAAGAALAYLLAPRQKGLLAAGLIYKGVPLITLLAVRLAGPDGAFVILWLVIVVVAADVGAYFVGRAVGGPKLWRAVSPGKTWSGALGGLAAAGTASLVLALAWDWNPTRALALGILVAVASQAGDLLESAVKRHFGVKDASRLIPGHGGVMDRLDALMGGAWAYALWSLAGPGVNGA
jgi:phosphatidate cytidylyltransferase